MNFPAHGGSQGGATQVGVQLGECDREDAQRVLRVLCEAYGSDRASPELRRSTSGRPTTVWSTFFDVAEVRQEPEPASLDGVVSADLQGATQAVNELEDALRRAFTVHEDDLVSGDQETELRVRLEGR